MKLFLTSDGISPAITGEFLKLLSKKPQDCRLVLVATAADPEPDKWFVDKDRARLRELGFTVEDVSLKNETEHSLSEIFKNTDIVFIEGGNTFYLLDLVRKSGFDKAIKLFLERGGIYVGVSAGSIIAGPTIETAAWKYADKNIVGLADLAGLGLVNFLISPHYDRETAAAVREAAVARGNPAVALAYGQAVLFDGDNIDIIGVGDKVVFSRSFEQDSNLPRLIREIGFDFNWSVEKVWKLAAPVVEIDIVRLVWHFEIPFYPDRGAIYCLKPIDVMRNPKKYPEEAGRMAAAAMEYPIDIMENKGRLVILDGLHRLMKAYSRSDRTVKARVIPREKILEILD